MAPKVVNNGPTGGGSGMLGEAIPTNLAMMSNLIPQTTANLEQQLLQCTAPGMKLGGGGASKYSGNPSGS